MFYSTGTTRGNGSIVRPQALDRITLWMLLSHHQQGLCIGGSIVLEGEGGGESKTELRANVLKEDRDTQKVT